MTSPFWSIGSIESIFLFIALKISMPCHIKWSNMASRSPLKIGTKRLWKSTPSCGFSESRVESLRSQARCGKRVTRKAVKPGGPGQPGWN